jgi:hypothetical protein
MAFWGYAIAGNDKMGLIAARNREQELIVYERATGREVLHVTLDRCCACSAILAGKEAIARGHQQSECLHAQRCRRR